MASVWPVSFQAGNSDLSMLSPPSQCGQDFFFFPEPGLASSVDSGAGD